MGPGVGGRALEHHGSIVNAVDGICSCMVEPWLGGPLWPPNGVGRSTWVSIPLFPTGSKVSRVAPRSSRHARSSCPFASSRELTRTTRLAASPAAGRSSRSSRFVSSTGPR
jgi:hypothetical protein